MMHWVIRIWSALKLDMTEKCDFCQAADEFLYVEPCTEAGLMLCEKCSINSQGITEPQ